MCILRTWTFLSLFLFSCSVDVSKSGPRDNESGKQNNVEEPNSSRQTLFLSADSNAEKNIVQLEYNKGKESKSPRVAEIFVKYSNELKYSSFLKQKSLIKSDKKAVVQEIDPGLLRIIVLSSENTNPIESGTLLSLSFEKTGDKPGKVEILTDQPIFAPAEANEGLLVGDPIEI